MSESDGSSVPVLGEGFFWMAEKLMWGYEDVQRNPAEAYRLYRQSADLNFSDAYIRLGELQEHGKGTELDPKAALKCYSAAARLGNFFAFAYLGKLLARALRLDLAEAMWARFFAALEREPDRAFACATRGELLHTYIDMQLRGGLEPRHRTLLNRFRIDIVGHHQRLLEHAPEARLDQLDAVQTWIHVNLGPWPATRL